MPGLPKLPATTHTATECIYRHCFNLVTSATRLGAFAGVLTALTFSTIIFLTGRERKDHPQVENTGVPGPNLIRP
jgi:hypothetical protein